MKSFLSVYKSILGAITKVFGWVSGLLILACGLMIVYEVVARGVFNSPTEWVMELATYCVTIGGFLGMGVAYAGRKHIRVDIILSKLSVKTKAYLGVFTTLAGAFYALIFTIEGLEMVEISFTMNNLAPTTLSTPLWIPQSSMPLGMALLFLQLVYSFFNNVNMIVTGEYKEEEV